MKKLLLISAALLVCFTLSSMAWAQNDQVAPPKDKDKVAGAPTHQMPERSNKPDKLRAQERAQQVHEMNVDKKTTKELQKPKGKELQETKGKELQKPKGKELQETKGKGLQESKGKGMQETKGKGLEESKGKALGKAEPKPLEKGKPKVKD